MSAVPMVPPGVVQSAIEEIFQTMYFSEAGYVGGARMESSMLGTAIGFSGEVSGEFRVAISERLAGGMAADFLALDTGEPSPDEIEAIVREFANVACGATMSAWKPEANFHFSVPGPLGKDSAADEFPYCFSVGGDGAELAIDIRIQ